MRVTSSGVEKSSVSHIAGTYRSDSSCRQESATATLTANVSQNAPRDGSVDIAVWISSALDPPVLQRAEVEEDVAEQVLPERLQERPAAALQLVWRPGLQGAARAGSWFCAGRSHSHFFPQSADCGWPDLCRADSWREVQRGLRLQPKLVHGLGRIKLATAEDDEEVSDCRAKQLCHHPPDGVGRHRLDLLHLATRMLQPQRDDLIQQPLPVLRPERRPADRLTIELCSRPTT
jgi:hypothetical protein